ncbi:Plasmid stabilization system protein [Pirellulimonas nuda]|uniref:Plasmid stabilization system protein n=1 Tax=Pirellulimonas nuda TaxID=2528009 RepID=A0A518D6V1_9BACT|nr:type II toxin-antitoxin system RelE/ParE family toxin [Pirellulimonas nuda]QDU87218.1 Plasmid stabilization system protein [Pirellulimonas nuda]
MRERRIECCFGSKLSRLSRNPEMGESFEISGRRMRRLTVRPYVLFYAADPNGVYVYRILHGARDIDSLMD